VLVRGDINPEGVIVVLDCTARRLQVLVVGGVVADHVVECSKRGGYYPYISQGSALNALLIALDCSRSVRRANAVRYIWQSQKRLRDVAATA
jgi:hypothetical protein